MAAGFGASGTALYVGDLGPNVTEADIRQKFAPFGLVDLQLRSGGARSQPFAYVNMASPAQAATALEELNYRPIRSTPVRIMKMDTDTRARKMGVGNIFVQNLPESFSTRDLYELFREFAPVASCKLATDDVGLSLRYGYVSLEDPQRQEEAIQHFDGMEVQENKLTVKQFMRAQQRTGPMRGQTNLYVKNLNPNLPEEYLHDSIHAEFSKYGELSSVAVKIDAQQRPFAFVDFNLPQDAAAAKKELHDAAQVKTVDGRDDLNFPDKLYVGYAMSRRQREQELRRLFQAEQAAALKQATGRNSPPNVPGAPPMGGPPGMPFPHGAYPVPGRGGPPAGFMGYGMPMASPFPRPVNGGKGGKGGYPSKRPINGPNDVQGFGNGNSPRAPQYGNFPPNASRMPFMNGPHGAPMNGYPHPQMQRPPQQAPPSQPVDPSLEALKGASSMSAEERQGRVGEVLYGQIAKMGQGEWNFGEERAAKITGMLLHHHEFSELLSLCESPPDLQASVREALDTLAAAAARPVEN